MQFAVGQAWSYAAPAEIADSRLVIGAMLEFEQGTTLACCSVIGALQRRPDGGLERVTIPFLPMTLEALAATVTAPDGEGPVADAFAAHFEDWRHDPRGLSYFTVPFEGTLERMIALQMAEIVGDDGAAAAAGA